MEAVISAAGIPIPITTLVNASGAPRSGARVYSWVPSSAGAPTATPRTLYTSPDATTTAAANPYVLGTSGQGTLYKRASEGVVVVIKGAEGASDAETTYAQVHYPAGVTVDSLGDEWLDLLEIDAEVFHVEAYADAAAALGDWTTAIQAASAALEANGGGILRGLRGKTYAVYPDATNTSPLGDFDNCKGVYLDFPGCTFTVGRAFTGSQIIYAWVFEGCDGVGWSNHNIVCTQQDDPADAFTRGTVWFGIGDTNSHVGGGSIDMTGGRIILDVYRSTVTVANRTSGIRIPRLDATNVGYPLALRNSGDDTVIGLINAVDVTRPIIAYGFKGLRARVEHEATTANGGSTILLLASGTGSDLDAGDPITEDVRIEYSTREGVTANAHIAIEARGTSPVVLRNFAFFLDIELDGAGSLSQQALVTRKTSASGVVDSTTRGHTFDGLLVSGSVRDVPATRIFDFFRTTDGDWAGETIRNFRVRDLVVTGSASATYAIDFDGFTDGPTFENFVFPGTPVQTGTMPDTYAEINVKDANGLRPLRFGNPRLAARSAGLPFPLAAITTAQTGVTGTTSETNLHTAVSVPAAALGTNGELRLSGSFTMTNNANAKTLNIKFGGTTFATAALASGAGYRFEAAIKNRNSAAAQNGGLAGSGLLASTTGTVNTANAADIQLTMTLADAGDTVTLQDLSVDLIYRA